MLPNELHDLPLFRGLDPERLARLAPLFAPAAFDSGVIVFSQGEPAKTVYVVLQGEASLGFRPEDGGWLAITTVRPGGILGWSAVLGRPRYTCSATCLTELRAIAILGAELRALVRATPEVGLPLLDRLAASVASRQPAKSAQVAQLIRAGIGGGAQ